MFRNYINVAGKRGIEDVGRALIDSHRKAQRHSAMRIRQAIFRTDEIAWFLSNRPA